MAKTKLNTKQVRVWISPRIRAFLETQCFEFGIAQSEYIRSLIVKEMLKNQVSLYDE